MNKIIIKEKLVLKKSIRKKLNKLLFTIIIFLIGLILIKLEPSLKPKLKKYIYEDSINFIKNRKIYNKYFGRIISNEEKEKTKEVSVEKINYKKEEKTKNGVKLLVNDNYSIPCIEDGIIIYVGEKEGLNTIIIEQIDGIKTTYANIENNNYKLYDFIEKGEIVGESINNEIYLSQEKEGVYLDYKKYI